MAKKIILIAIISLFLCKANAQVEVLVNEDAVAYIKKYETKDLILHVNSKSTKDSIPDLSFYLIYENTALPPDYDTLTIKSVKDDYVLFGDIKRIKNDIYFNTIIKGQYTLQVFVGEKKYARRFFLSLSDPHKIELTVDVD